MKTLKYIIAAFLLLSSSSLMAAESLKEGTPAPAFTLMTVNKDVVKAKNISLGSYFSEGKNTKLLIMSFFATYCVPCRNEIPFLEALYESYHDQGLEIAIISIDKEQDKIDTLAQISKEEKLTFPVLWDRLNIVAKRYGIEKLPHVYMLGADGKVFKVNTGYDANSGAENLHDTIKKALGIPVDAQVPPAVAKFLNKNKEKKEIKGQPKAQNSQPAAAAKEDQPAVAQSKKK